MIKYTFFITYIVYITTKFLFISFFLYICVIFHKNEIIKILILNNYIAKL